MATIARQCQSQSITDDCDERLLFVGDGLLIDTDRIQCEGMRQEDGSIARE
jgi:hypothetical protein